MDWLSLPALKRSLGFVHFFDKRRAKFVLVAALILAAVPAPASNNNPLLNCVRALTYRLFNPAPLSDIFLQQDLERQQAELKNSRGRGEEDKLYKLAADYAQFVPELNSMEDLIKEGILRIDGEGFLVSDYVIQGTNLAALTLQKLPSGEFKILANRGSGYFSGSKYDWGTGLASAGGWGIFYQPKNPENFALLKSGAISTVVLIPRTEVSRLLLQNPDHFTNEVILGGRELSEAHGVKVYRLPKPINLDQIDKYCQDHFCQTTDWRNSPRDRATPLQVRAPERTQAFKEHLRLTIADIMATEETVFEKWCGPKNSCSAFAPQLAYHLQKRGIPARLVEVTSSQIPYMIDGKPVLTHTGHYFISVNSDPEIIIDPTYKQFFASRFGKANGAPQTDPPPGADIFVGTIRELRDFFTAHKSLLVDERFHFLSHFPMSLMGQYDVTNFVDKTYGLGDLASCRKVLSMFVSWAHFHTYNFGAEPHIDPFVQSNSDE